MGWARMQAGRVGPEEPECWLVWTWASGQRSEERVGQVGWVKSLRRKSMEDWLGEMGLRLGRKVGSLFSHAGDRWRQILGVIRVQHEVKCVYLWTPVEADPRGD